MPLMPQARLAGPELGLQRSLEILSVGWGLFVQDHEIHCQLLHPPVFVGAKQLSDNSLILGFVDADQNNRDVAGNSVPPERRGPPGIACEDCG